ncbi:MAG: 50S ribosomal protein L5 [Candidatus Marinimicrobia bacterium]|nr:50S ribosomal protein L5 [Candidatus Neomarinimicrobiota bacterium]
MPRLKRLYHEKILKSLLTQRGYKNIWQVPRMEKIVLNMGLGTAREDAKVLQGALDDLATITGQKAVITYAKKPISNFKIRLKDPIGAKVTLRKNHMWEFMDRLMSLAIPRVRDFRGLPNKSFDGRGNYSMGLTEQIVFPEIDYDKIDQIRGMDVTFVTTAKTDEESYDLLSSFGFPFRPRPQDNQEGSEA